jgi:hypothetical protein
MKQVLRTKVHLTKTIPEDAENQNSPDPLQGSMVIKNSSTEKSLDPNGS